MARPYTNKRQRKLEIESRLCGKYHLIVLESSLLHIPERLLEYDSDLFIIFNTKTQKFEVHSLANQGNTHCLTVPYEELDDRAINMFAKYDQRRRSFKAIIREIDRENEVMGKREAKNRRSELNAMAREVRPAFKKLAEEVY